MVDDDPVIDAATAAFIGDPRMCVAATRDAAGVPSLARVVACRVLGDGRTLRILVKGRGAARFCADLAAGSPVAVVLSQPSTFRTVQLKAGRVAASAVAAADLAAAAAAAAQLGAELRALGHEAAFIAAHLDYEPDDLRAFDCRVDEAYVQTPGPGAGARLRA